MKQETLKRLVDSISLLTVHSDYPLCYSQAGQVLTMNNTVLYMGTVDNAKKLVSELNRAFYQTKDK